jgi:hypothetical protein
MQEFSLSPTQPICGKYLKQQMYQNRGLNMGEMNRSGKLDE